MCGHVGYLTYSAVHFACSQYSEYHVVMTDPDQLSADQRDFVNSMGNLLGSWGLALSTGRLFGYLLLQNSPVALDTIASEMGASKSGISVAARQLEGWSLARRVPQPGTKRVAYAVVDDPEALLLYRFAQIRTFRDRLQSGEKVTEGRALMRLANLASICDIYLDYGEKAVQRWRELSDESSA